MYVRGAREQERAVRNDLSEMAVCDLTPEI